MPCWVEKVENINMDPQYALQLLLQSMNGWGYALHRPFPKPYHQWGWCGSRMLQSNNISWYAKTVGLDDDSTVTKTTFCMELAASLECHSKSPAPPPFNLYYKWLQWQDGIALIGTIPCSCCNHWYVGMLLIWLASTMITQKQQQPSLPLAVMVEATLPSVIQQQVFIKEDCLCAACQSLAAGSHWCKGENYKKAVRNQVYLIR